jgi:hypothetical protein
MPKVEAPASLHGYKRPVFRSPAMAAAQLEARWRRLLPLGMPSFGWAAPVARVAAALVILSMAMGSTIVASANSLPDEPLYPVKLTLENAQLALASTDEARADLELRFASKRVAEVQSAAEQGKHGAVAHGLALYQQTVEDAVHTAERISPPDPAATEKLQESLRQNIEALQQVEQKVQNDGAQAAVAAAIARSHEASGGDKGSRGKSEEAPSRPNSQPKAAVAATSTPTTVPDLTGASASPPATATPSGGQQPPGKANGRTEEPGNSGQDGSPATKPQGSGKLDGPTSATDRPTRSR